MWIFHLKGSKRRYALELKLSPIIGFIDSKQMLNSFGLKQKLNSLQISLTPTSLLYWERTEPVVCKNAKIWL